MAPDTELEEIQRLGQFKAIRRLPDGTIAATGELLFTRALYLKVDSIGWSRRFCFDERERADQELAKLTSCNDEPTGWIAKRPQD